MTKTSSNATLDFQRIFPIFILVFVDVLGLTVILPLLHLYAATFGATPLQIGLVAAAFPLAQLIGVPMMGALSDRFGRKPLLLISQITTCISFIMLGLAGSLEMIILSRVIDGLFGANIATAQAALSDITTDETRSQGLGLTGAAFGLGFIFGPIISIIALETSDQLYVPAFSAAVYSFMSILLTWFLFEETHPPEKRGQSNEANARFSPAIILRYLLNGRISVLLILMFAQQVIFFGFESLLGLFTLSRLGLLGQGNAIIFIIVGFLLVMVQVRLIGKWSRKYGEAKLVTGALALIAVGLILIAYTPAQTHLFYVREITEYNLLTQADVSSMEAIIGEIGVELPPNGNNGIIGVLWLVIAIVPLSIGAGLIRPSLNSLMTKRVSKQEYGGILGVSSSFVSAANAIAPLLGGYLFQQYSVTTPFLLGGISMFVLVGLSWLLVRDRKPSV